MKEIWKDIVGYEGSYQVSNSGKVRSLNYLGHGKTKELSPGVTRDDYLIVCLSKNNQPKHFTVHRLVATHFLDNHRNKPEVDHIDNDRQNNHVENLRWVTRQENVSHRDKQKRFASNRTLLGKFGREHPASKPILQFSDSGEFIAEFSCINEASRKIGISHSQISSVCHGRYRTASGYKWRFKN